MDYEIGGGGGGGGGSISIKLNDENNPYFKLGKGPIQGDPLLFNLVPDIFTRVLIKAAKKGYFLGFMSYVYPEEVISLQYADDTLLFLNYNKSDLVPMNLYEEETLQYVKNLCCKIGDFPFKYLEVPLHYEKLRKEDIQPVVDKIINRIPR
jgi:hypothetical protein